MLPKNMKPSKFEKPAIGELLCKATLSPGWLATEGSSYCSMNILDEKGNIRAISTYNDTVIDDPYGELMLL